MQQYNVIFSKKFRKNISQIHNFIKKDDNRYADAVINSIFSHCTGLLSIMPYMWSMIDTERNIRKTIEKSFNYKITYIIQDEIATITILSVSKHHF